MGALSYAPLALQANNQIVRSTQDPDVDFGRNLSLAAHLIGARFGLEPHLAALIADLARIGTKEAA